MASEKMDLDILCSGIDSVESLWRTGNQKISLLNIDVNELCGDIGIDMIIDVVGIDAVINAIQERGYEVTEEE